LGEIPKALAQRRMWRVTAMVVRRHSSDALWFQTT
jgi:hypothetical protein